jgi:hypothetical protein
MHPLWTKARDIIRTLFLVNGEPQNIASLGHISRKLYAHVLSWIRAGETLLRRMLLIEAHALNAPPPRKQQRENRKRQRKLVTFHPDKPEDWRVHFRCISSSPARGGSVERRSRETKEDAPPFAAFDAIDTWPLALRAEALLRICNNPAPYIARLARVIARKAALVARILKPPHEPKRRSGDPAHQPDLIGRAFFAELNAALPNTS